MYLYSAKVGQNWQNSSPTIRIKIVFVKIINDLYCKYEGKFTYLQ